VGIRDFKFVPAELTTTSGTEVTWRNQDTAPHSVKWADDTESSPTLADGETYARTFTAAGTFEYVCGIHPNMKGSVVVS
jgi:plastocyanin